jgi:biotin carboxylase
VAVVFGEGAAAPREIAASLPRGWSLAWVVRASDPLYAMLRPVLASSGALVETDDQLNPLGVFPDVHGITTFSGQLVTLTAQAATRLGLRYHSVEAAHTLTNKAAQRARLSETGVDAVRYEVVTSADALAEALDRVGFPAVLKPVEGFGSRYTFSITDETSADVTRRHVPTAAWRAGMILEEQFRGIGSCSDSGLADYVSVEICTFMGRHEVVAIVGRLPPAKPFRERGAVFPVPMDPGLSEAVRSVAVDALSSIGVTYGVTHTEIKLTPNGPRIIEINGRMGGHVNHVIKRTGGPDLIKAELGTATGVAPQFGVWEPIGVAFRYLIPAPSCVGRVRHIEGIAKVRELTGVELVAVRARNGTWCDWRQGTGSFIAQVEGWVPGHTALAHLISRIDETVVIHLDQD